MPEPWLTIIGIGEDGLAGLCDAARGALLSADSVFGAPRHLALAEASSTGTAWPVPFSITPLLERRGTRTVALVSGDPFWFGAGSMLAKALDRQEWRVFPGLSTFSLVAAHCGWPLEDTACLGLHAAPLDGVIGHLRDGARLICLLRDGAAPAAIARMLVGAGFGRSVLTTLVALGGPRAESFVHQAEILAETGESLAPEGLPVALAIAAYGGPGLPAVPGLDDDVFAHDGQITKAPVRALALAALAPRRGEWLWDIGAGSGSISIEWCRAGGHALAIEKDGSRAARIRANGARLGVSQRLKVMEGEALAVLAEPSEAFDPQAIFIGGGANEALLAALLPRLSSGVRIVIHAVTLETERLLLDAHARHGGDLMRFSLETAAPLGRFQGFVPARPITQWRFIQGGRKP